MSGPYDVPEDPDDVTLWAGRLRAWPTRPSAPADADEIDDDTAVSARLAPADDTVRSVRDAPADDTVRSVRDAPADDTVRSVRDAPAEDTVRVERDAPADDTGRSVRDAPADDTVQVRQVRTAPEPESVPSDVPADETVRVARDRRVPDTPGAADVEETTAPGRRRGAESAPPAPANTEDEVPPSDTAAGVRRSRSRVRDETPEIPSGDPAPVPRAARIPAGDHELYRPRADEAIRVTRALPPARPTDAPDAAEVRPRTPRRARIRGLVLAVTVVAVVVAAVTALFLLMG